MQPTGLYMHPLCFGKGHSGKEIGEDNEKLHSESTGEENVKPPQSESTQGTTTLRGESRARRGKILAMYSANTMLQSCLSRLSFDTE